jgi:hypothetical protein
MRKGACTLRSHLRPLSDHAFVSVNVPPAQPEAFACGHRFQSKRSPSNHDGVRVGIVVDAADSVSLRSAFYS